MSKNSKELSRAVVTGVLAVVYEIVLLSIIGEAAVILPAIGVGLLVAGFVVFVKLYLDQWSLSESLPSVISAGVFGLVFAAIWMTTGFAAMLAVIGVIALLFAAWYMIESLTRSVEFKLDVLSERVSKKAAKTMTPNPDFVTPDGSPNYPVNPPVVGATVLDKEA